jgi:conjugal transfer pilus assembly protein TraD
VIANTNNWIIFRVIDGETQKYISEALPKTAVKGLDQGYRSATRSDDPVQFSATYTESLKEHDTELLPPALLGMLPNFHYFARIGAKGATWKGKVPILEY